MPRSSWHATRRQTLDGGAGKTVLACRLGQLLGLPVVHLDALRYDPSWSLVPEDVFTALQREHVARPQWIIDGNSTASLYLHAAAADTVMVVDPHPLTCLYGVLRRRLRYHGGQHHQMGVFDRITWSFVRYVTFYRRRHLPRVLARVHEYSGQVTLIHVRSRRAANRLISQLQPECGYREGHS